jgi:hypothetical protein
VGFFIPEGGSMAIAAQEAELRRFWEWLKQFDEELDYRCDSRLYDVELDLVEAFQVGASPAEAATAVLHYWMTRPEGEA